MGEYLVRLRGAGQAQADRLSALLGPELTEDRIALEKEWDRLEAERRLELHAELPAAADAPRRSQPALRR